MTLLLGEPTVLAVSVHGKATQDEEARASLSSRMETTPKLRAYAADEQVIAAGAAHERAGVCDLSLERGYRHVTLAGRAEEKEDSSQS